MTDLTPSDVPALFPDLEPTPQVDLSPVCTITYTSDFVQAYDYLRTVLRTDERSERTLQLTGLCLKLNPANYTVWHYRRRILAALKVGDTNDGGSSDDEKMPPLDQTVLQSELEMASALGGKNPKNYQIWYHRRALLEPILATDNGASDENAVNIAKKELAYIATVLVNDGKNYHAWSHRQWILRSVSNNELWQFDLSYTDTLISKDIRNNSAWNHRWFVCHRGLQIPSAPADAAKECEYALSAAAKDPHNESPWIYLIGTVKEQVRSKSEGSDGLVDNTIKEAKRVRSIVGDVACPNADSACIDLLDMSGGMMARSEAAALAHKLGTEDDAVRRKYWALREGKLKGEEVTKS